MLNWPAHRYLFAIATLRWLALVAQAITIAVVQWVLQLDLNYTVLWTVAGVSVLLTAATFVRLRIHRRLAVYDGELFMHLILDAGLLSILLFQSGGATNPFISFLLVPIALGASILSSRWTIILTAIAIAAYTMLMKWHRPLPGSAHIHGDGFQWHIWGMWITFVVSALLLAGFIGRAAAWARLHQQQLSQFREQKLRDEQLLSMATLAAGTAHELGTPLTTMSVLIDELKPADDHTEALQDWHLLRTQLQRCRDILQRLRSTAEPAEAQTVAQTVRQISEQFALVRPQNHCAITIDPVCESLQWRIDKTVQQAILNVVNNAADASTDIDLHVHYDAPLLIWQIRDRGRGINADVRAQFGLPLRSEKSFGVGIGLFLTNASIERAGGRVVLLDRDGGGTCVRIELPMHCELEKNDAKIIGS